MTRSRGEKKETTTPIPGPPSVDPTNGATPPFAEANREILEKMTDAFIAVDRNWHITYINHQGEFLLDRKREEIVGRSLWGEYPDLQGTEFEKAYKDAMDIGTASTFTAFYPHHDRWYEVNVYPVDSGINLYARNVTQGLQTEAALAETRSSLDHQSRVFETTLSSITDFAYTFDRQGKFIFANRALLDLLGISLSEIEGKDFFELDYPDELAARLQSQIEQVFKTGKSVKDETPFTSPSGAEGYYEYIFNPVFAADSTVDVVAGSTRDITERKENENALRKSEERRKLAQDAGNIGLWDWDLVTDETYWSETMWSIYGQNPNNGAHSGLFFSSFIYDSDRERVSLSIDETLQSGKEKFNEEFRIMRGDGAIRWIESIATISRDTTGKATRMYGVNVDITIRKDTEERLKLSENQLRLVTNAVPALISYVDSSERYRFVNQRFTDWFGTPIEKLVGQKVQAVLGSEAYKIIKPRLDKVLSGEPCTFESLITYKGAGTRYVHGSYMPDIGVDGTVYGYYSLVQDLTDLQKSRDLLRSSEERTAMIVENVSDYAIFSMDSDGIVDSWNIGAEVIFGYLSDEIIGRPYSSTFTPEDIKAGIPDKEFRIAREKGKAADDRWHLRKDGTRFFANGVIIPLYVGRTLTGYAKIAGDLTEKHRQAEELQRAHDELEIRVRERTRELAESNLALLQEMEVRESAENERIELLGRLVTSQEFERRRIAADLHDQLGQRLTALRLKIASLKEVTADDPDISERVERLQQIAEKLDSEVSFLAWELRPTALDDLGLIDAVGAFVNEWSRHSEIEADFHASGLSKTTLNDETGTHLYRITQEALNNITKHAEADYVTVLLERREENIILIVEDNGQGFDPNKIKVTRESGRGLGLIGMRERATLVGGEVEFESSPGRGTTIYVRVPI